MKEALRVENIRKSFFDFKAVKDISFSLRSGEVLGIIGPNGAGKTTTVKIILGLLEPDSGTVELLGGSNKSSEIRHKIGYMPETPSFYANLTGREIMSLAGRIFDLNRSTIKKRSAELLELVGMSEAANRQLRTYSKGMLQRICLAQSLMNKPELLFLDEPMDGLDPIGRIRMREVIQKIQKEGTAIVLNSHILSDVELMSNHIAIMDRGTLLAWKPTSALVPKGTSLETVFLNTIEKNI